jgi:hypothetical protein
MKNQMELGFERCNANVRPASPRRRIPGARWWFQQMHRVVDQAIDWSAPQARPEQTYMTLASARTMRTQVTEAMN